MTQPDRCACLKAFLAKCQETLPIVCTC
uniref:Uncharacterized protein n=1 Tax=Anguilla anguilla TaxID=7936 RepID=A0A0E9TJQ0_ANGAN